MKVVAQRGVCIGPGQHLLPGDEADVDKATALFLVNIGAVQLVPDAAPVAAAAAPARGRKSKPAPAPAEAPPPDPIASEGAEQAPQPQGV